MNNHIDQLNIETKSLLDVIRTTFNEEVKKHMDGTMSPLNASSPITGVGHVGKGATA